MSELPVNLWKVSYCAGTPISTCSENGCLIFPYQRTPTQKNHRCRMFWRRADWSCISWTGRDYGVCFSCTLRCLLPQAWASTSNQALSEGSFCPNQSMPSGPKWGKSTTDRSTSLGNWNLRCTYKTWLSQQPLLALEVNGMGCGRKVQSRGITASVLRAFPASCCGPASKSDKDSDGLHLPSSNLVRGRKWSWHLQGERVWFKGKHFGAHWTLVWIWFCHQCAD